MKRAEDFEAFMSPARALGDSLDMFPDAPPGVDDYSGYLVAVRDSKPVADDPYEKSGLRGVGLKVWDSVYRPFPMAVRTEPVKLRDISPLRSINSTWEDTKARLGMIGRPDGVHYIRPKGEFVFDAMNDDMRILQGAHILTHLERFLLPKDDFTFGESADLFHRNLVKLVAARKYGLKISVRPNDESIEDSFSLYGIDVCASSDLRSPVLLESSAEHSGGRMVMDKTIAFLLGSVGVEPHPMQAEGDSLEWKEIDRWACLPTLVSLSGWECVDYVLHSESVLAKGGFLQSAVPCEDLQGMDSFGELLEKARKARGEPSGKFVMGVDEWLDSEHFRKCLEFTPQLPCPQCMCLNEKARGCVCRPRTNKPPCRFKEIGPSSQPELQEWAKYVKFMRRCVEIGRKATTYASGSETSMKKRNSAYRKRAESHHKWFSMMMKASRMSAAGYPSEAMAIRMKADAIKKEMMEQEGI